MTIEYNPSVSPGKIFYPRDHSIALIRKEEARKRRNLIVNTCHLLLTPLTVIRGNLELAKQCNKAITPEVLSILLGKVEEIQRRVNGQLHENINRMTVETSDGLNPVVRS